MIWKNLAMWYFRHHVHTEIEFQLGLTGIIGENGAGKTTITEAVAWALYGSQAALTSNDKLVYDRKERGDLCQVRFTFEVAGNEYIVTRFIGAANVQASGSVVAEGSKVSTAYITELLGQTFIEWSNSVFTKQGKLEWMEGNGRAEKERFVSSQIGYGRLKPAQQAARDRGREIASSISGLEEILEKGVERSDQVTEEQVADRKTNLDAAEREKVASAEAETESHRSLEAMRKARDARHDLTSRLEVIGAALKEKREEHGRLTEKLTTAGDVESAVEALLGEETRKIGLVKDRLASVEQTKDKVNDAGVALHHARTGFEVADKELARVRKTIATIVRLGSDGECPTCLQDLATGHDHALEKLEAENATAAAAHTKWEEARTQAGSFSDTAAQAAKVADEQWQVAVDEKNDATLKLQQAKTRAVDIRSAKDTLSAITEKIAAGENAIRELDSQLADNDHNEGTYRERHERHAQYRTTASDAVQALIAAERTYSFAKTSFDAAQANEARIQASRDRLNELRIEQATVSDTDRMFGEMRNVMNARIRPDISAIASELIADMSNGRFTGMEIDEEFDLALMVDGRRIPLASGGEKAIANLAVRLAISRLIAERSGAALDAVVLDEVFGSLSESRRPALAEVLRGLIGTRFQQIIVILHEPSVRDLMDHLIEVRLTEDGQAKVYTQDTLKGGSHDDDDSHD